MGGGSHQGHVRATLLSRPGLSFLFEPLGGGPRTLLFVFCMESENQESQGLERSLIPSPAKPGW